LKSKWDAHDAGGDSSRVRGVCGEKKRLAGECRR